METTYYLREALEQDDSEHNTWHTDVFRLYAVWLLRAATRICF
jgi:hypothetical protein